MNVTHTSNTQSPEFRLHSLPPAGKQPEYLASLIAQIWPKRATEIYELFLKGASDIENINDHPFVVKINGSNVGITGFYLYDKEEQKEVGLSWHGVVPEVRKQGLSKRVFDVICQIAREVYPNASHIVELIPEDRHSELAPYFAKLGFVFSGEYANFEYLPKTTRWLIYKAPISIPTNIDVEIKSNPMMIEMGDLSFTVNQYWYLKNYKPPVNPRTSTKQEIWELFNL